MPQRHPNTITSTSQPNPCLSHAPNSWIRCCMRKSPRLVLPAHNATATNMFQMATSHWEEVAHCPLWVKSGHGRARRDVCFVPKAVIADRPLNYLVLSTPRPAPATAAEPPAIGLDGAVIHIEVSAWCRCGVSQNGFGAGKIRLHGRQSLFHNHAARLGRAQLASHGAPHSRRYDLTNGETKVPEVRRRFPMQPPKKFK